MVFYSHDYGDFVIEGGLIEGRIDVFYKVLGRHKRYDEILRKNYKRICEHKSHVLVELSLGFDYQRHCVYVLKSHLEGIEQEREKRAHIRKGILSHI